MKKIFLSLVLCACGPTPQQDDRFDVQRELHEGPFIGAGPDVQVIVVTDKRTGKEYIGVRAGTAGIPLTEVTK